MVVFSYVLMTLLMFSGLFLIGLVLLQRGRGGGLAGAFGGMGGQSAFGTKAGDVFTRITIGVATAWILLCAGSVVALHHASGGRTDNSLFKDTQETQAKDNDSEVKAEPKSDEATVGAGKEDPDTPPPAAPQTPAAPQGSATPASEKKAEEKPAEEKKADEAAPAKPEEAKPAEAAKSDAAPVEEKKSEPPKAEEPKPADEAKQPAEPAAEPVPEKKPE